MLRQDKHFIIACVLGDGCINQRVVNNTTQCRFTMRHSHKQFDYFMWKVERLSTILSNKHAHSSVPKFEDNSGRSKILSLRFERNHPYLKVLYRFIYQNNRKTFSRKVLDRLTPEGLAVWFMDDGSLYNVFNKQYQSYTKCQARLNTYLSKEENEVIIKYFKEKWDVEWKNEKEKNFYRLRCGTKEFRKFVEIIKPYMHKSMLYKIDIKIDKYKTDLPLNDGMKI